MLRVRPLWPLALGVLVLVSAWMAPGTLPSTLRAPAPSVGTSVLVVVPAIWRGDAALSLAVDDLLALLRSAYGFQTEAAADSAVSELPPLSVVVGDQQNRWVSDLVQSGQLSLPDLAPEGYVIRRVERPGKLAVIVGAHDVLGSAYGLFRLAELSQLSPAGLLSPWQVTAEPAMTLRAVSDPLESSYPSPEQALRWGFNAIFVEPWPSLALYDGLDPAPYDPQQYAADRAWVEENRQRTRDRIAQAHRLHLRVISWGDVPSFPRQALELYGEEVGPGRFCLDRPRTRELLSHALDEVLNGFDLDYVMVRTGENYPLGPLVGNSPTDQACGGPASFQPLALAELVYDRVARTHGKTYIQRAWDLGSDGMHANPVAGTLLAGLPADRFVLSYKHTRTDFWRYNAVNPNLGQGPFAQMVEFQAAREYEGKGAFPNYLGEVFSWGGEEARPRGGMEHAFRQGVRDVWVWAKGGGWGGPRPQRDLWVDANVYALSHLAWDPQASPADLARQWASLRFGRAAAPSIERLLLKSDDAVLYAFYSAPAARHRGDWAPNNLWVRDDVVRGGDWIAELYRSSREPQEFATALAEKEIALKLVDSMVADYRQALPQIGDPLLAADGLNSLLYERALVHALSHYFSGMFYYYRWLDSDTADLLARKRALSHLREWQDAWRYYTQVAAGLPGVATPYRSEGMLETAGAALEHLTRD